MKIKTSELTGAALNWAVAKCEGYPMGIWYDEDGLPMVRDDEVPEWKPSTDWSQGGPMIERERIDVFYENHTTGSWCGSSPRGHKVGWRYLQYGPTPLIAAMRCYVASKLGNEVDVPEPLDKVRRGAD